MLQSPTINRLVEVLEAERDEINQALSILRPVRRGRPPKDGIPRMVRKGWAAKAAVAATESNGIRSRRWTPAMRRAASIRMKKRLAERQK